MENKIKKINYDLENDIFYMSNGEKVKASLDIGDFILDVNYDNLICGVEIMDASDNLGIGQDNLKQLQNIKMSVAYRTNHVYILLMMTFKKQEKDVNISIPLALDLGHKKPKKETLVYN